MDRPRASISSDPAKVPGTWTPWTSLCSRVREVEKPRAPAATPSRTMLAISAISPASGR